MKKYVVLSLLFLLINIVNVKIQFSKKSPVPTHQKQRTENSIIYANHLFDPAFFTQAYDKGQHYENVASEHISGGIIPHHLLAAPLIAGFFESIAKQKITTVILLSPNHYGIGKHSVSSSDGTWKTLFGNLETDQTKISQLRNDKAVTLSNDIFQTEHGIYSITPFIKKTFPQAKIVPIMIKGGTPKQECDMLISSLNKIIDDQTILLVSSDFSHYLPSNQADQYDKESISAIESFDTTKILNIDHEKNIDSPESIYTLLKVMQLRKATTPTVITNTNSAKLTGHPQEQSTTSYVTMSFANQRKNISTDTFFNYSEPEKISKKNATPNEYTIIATGDVIPARSVNTKLVQLQNFNYPFEKTVSFLKSADAVFMNLESPLIPNCKTTIEGMIFCGDERAVQGLIYASTTVVNIANNHAGNYGINGINNTIGLLKKNNIAVTGNGESAIISIKGKRFGFLGYNDIGGKEAGIAWADEIQMQKDIQNLRKQVDVILVAFHWGVEYVLTPNAQQIALAHAAIDAGADVIIGNHPHWVQGIEHYKGKFITYAHGNYVFDQMWSQETREGVLGKYTFNDQGLINVAFVPVIIDNYSQPRFATKAEAQKILNRMKESTEQIKTLH
jgi:AmmeMemoRadiSam system protein B